MGLIISHLFSFFNFCIILLIVNDHDYIYMLDIVMVLHHLSWRCVYINLDTSFSGLQNLSVSKKKTFSARPNVWQKQLLPFPSRISQDVTS